MIVIRSPKLKKQAQNTRPWEFSPKEMQDLEPINNQAPSWELTPEEEREFDLIGEQAPPVGQPATKEDFRAPSPPPPPPVEDIEEPGFEIKPTTDFSFLPFAPTPDGNIPINPQQFIGEDIEIPTTPIEDANETLGIREKIFYSLNNATPLKISYTTIDGGSTTDRTIHPDYVYWAGTNRHILVAWDKSKNDWRAFAVDNINLADLVDPDAEQIPTAEAA